MRTAPLFFTLLLLSSLSSSALADDGVLRAPAPPAAPNLRVFVACADSSFATPDEGLRATLDGVPLSPGTVEYGWAVTTTRHGSVLPVSIPTSVGYAAPPGLHQISLVSSGCAPMQRSIEVPASGSLDLAGSLETLPRLRGAADAPNGPTFGISATYSTFPSSLTSGVASLAETPPTYTLTGSSIIGGRLSLGGETRHFVGRLDLGAGGGSYSGRIEPTNAPGLTPASGPLTMTGTVATGSLTARVGARVPLGPVALAGGSGVGGAIWYIGTPTINGTPGTDTSNIEGVNAIWNVPLWASIEVKPACDLGFEVTASYNVEPTNLSADTFLLSAGLLYQPTDACSRSPHLDPVTPPHA